MNRKGRELAARMALGTYTPPRGHKAMSIDLTTSTSQFTKVGRFVIEHAASSDGTEWIVVRWHDAAADRLQEVTLTRWADRENDSVSVERPSVLDIWQHGQQIREG